MNTLRQYHKGEVEIKNEDFIFIDKFESLFSRIQNGKDIIKFEPIRENTKDELLSIFKKSSDFNKFVLLSSNPDTDIPCIKKEYLLQDNIPYSEELQKELDNKQIDYFLENSILEELPGNVIIYCHSVIKSHPSIKMIPLGRDFKGMSTIYSEKIDLYSNRNILCYYNCSIPPKSIHWYGRIRAYIYDSLIDKKFISYENVDLVNLRQFGNQEFLNYYKKIAHSKFMICPRGCGLDTYRLWDCLYLGCIPIVVKYEGYSEFEDLPILFIDKWEDYLALTEEYLNVKYLEMLDKKYNYEKLKFSWWENSILSKISSLD
jgi:hypothetical protein